MAGSIVVIDSEPTVRKVITTVLESNGYFVRATGEFDEAVEIIREERPDLVLTNVFLRGIAGHDAMHVLKDHFPGMRVLMVSGLPDEKAISVWTGEIGFDVFPKPFKATDLLGKVRDILSR